MKINLGLIEEEPRSRLAFVVCSHVAGLGFLGFKGFHRQAPRAPCCPRCSASLLSAAGSWLALTRPEIPTIASPRIVTV